MKFLIIILTILFSRSVMAEPKDVIHQNCIFNKKVCLFNKDDSEFIFANGKYYPSVSYYNNIIIKPIDKISFQIINSYTDSSPVTIYSTFYLKDKIIYLYSIKTISYPNISPSGAKQVCNIFIKSIFNKPLEYYVDSKIFDLSERDKIKVCTTIKNR